MTATILYLTRNGLLEPLGQSQVLPYLRGLARDWRIILVTREKEADWTDARAVTEARAECEALGIDWRPRPFRPHPRYIGPVRDILVMTGEVLRAARGEGVRLVHARSYIPAAVAWAVWRLTGTPFIFDMRALWPEELVVAGRLRRGSLLHRAIMAIERACLRDAAAIVSLTQAAVEHLREYEPRALASKPVVVIPTCADLKRFTPRHAPIEGARVHGCIGTILSGWFRADWLATWFAGVAGEDADALFEIVTRDDPARVRAAVDPLGALGQRLSIGPRHPREMPDAIRGHHVSVMFYAGGEISELGRAPTRMAEALGSGLPVVANEGVGDVARILREHRVGILMEGPEPAKVQPAMRALDKLLADPDLAARCRAAADALFSLETGTESYRALYQGILTSPTDRELGF
ncbi:MAG TPA: glycosyltransferase [Sphingomonadaceae bacterium]|nr:glycosyltransferase [Sphingomonadaceae bacterium]